VSYVWRVRGCDGTQDSPVRDVLHLCEEEVAAVGKGKQFNDRTKLAMYMASFVACIFIWYVTGKHRGSNTQYT